MRRRLALAAIAGLVVAAPSAAVAAPFERALPIPEVLTGSRIDIRMQQSEVQLRPGPKTRMWTYNGTFPGPTIRRPSGTVTRMTFFNDLPAWAGDMSVHHHGAHSASTEDGQPHQEPGAGPGGLLIPPGGAREYRYDHVEDGAPERAAFQWYHDHRMDVTGRNVWNGLAGMFILDDEVDAALPLPEGEYDVPLMVVDRRLDAENQLVYPGDLLAQTPLNGGPPADGMTGDVILVNGAAQPHFDVADRKYRLRLLNASNFRTFDFRLSDGSPMKQIASESGLLPAPVDRGTVSLGPAERAEVVVDFAGLRGRTLTLTSAAGDVMQFRVNRSDPEPDTTRVPASLRPAPALGPSKVDRIFNFGLGFDPERNRIAWTINGRVYDHNRVDASPKLGSTETWQLTNVTSSGVPHYIHIHGVDWRVISR
nr:multicopper oxidase domain-containing protein [Acidimicrobiia bacterium]